MQSPYSRWFWRGVWIASLLVALGLFLLYAWLPVDGGTGDLESFRPGGFDVQWLLEKREGGLQVGDTIVRGGGHTVDEWLSGAPRGPEWQTGGVVQYEIVRGGRPKALEVQLAPVPFLAILDRWGLQLLVAVTLVVVGAFVFLRRPQELAARVLMLFCITIALQFWGDAYNLQYATLPWRWPFWLQLAYEHLAFGLCLASICYFVLLFPATHPLIELYPRLVPFVLFTFYPVAVAVAMLLSPSWSMAMIIGSGVGWAIAIIAIGLAIAIGLRSARVARNPVARAQVRWMLWCAGVGCAIMVPLYILPLILTSRPLLPHPVSMLLIAFVPFTLAVAILRFRLFDIEVLINRTLVYGTLTVLLAGLYLLVVQTLTFVIGRGWQGENGLLVSFVATLSIVLAFSPLHGRVQALIDRTFYRGKLDLQQLLPELSEKLATSILLDDLAEVLTDELPRRLQIAGARLAVLEAEGQHLVYTGSGNPPTRLSIHDPLPKYLSRERSLVLRRQPPPDLPAGAAYFLEESGIELCMPLFAGEKLVGLYNLGPKWSGMAYSGGEVGLVRLLGQQAAVSVENARLFQSEREQRQLAQALQEAADAVSSSLDLNQVLDRILEQVALVVEGDAANVMLLRDGIARVVRWRGYDQLGVEQYIARLNLYVVEYPTLTQMAFTGQPLVVRDTRTDPTWVPREGFEWLRSMVSAPIQIAGETIGFLNVDRKRTSQSAKADARRIEAFAHHAAIALDHAWLYEQAQQEIAERQRAEGQLRTSLREKEVLLKEIHHRVKNNLQVISSLLYLQSKRVIEPETLKMFVDSQNRVRSMALVHEQLYQTEDLARVNVAEYVRSLASFLFRSYGLDANRIRLKIDVAELSLGVNVAVPCGMIINELLSNILKHAFPGDARGAIYIGFSSGTGGRYTLVVEDNGIGFPAELDFRRSRSLGLQLVNTLVEQLEGTIELDTRTGTRFQIVFDEPG
jgi:two-component sensor histidine kinase